MNEVSRIDPAQGKTQNIRLLDVFVIGPLMTWAGYWIQDNARFTPDRNKTGTEVAGQALMISGLATIAYNGANYLRIRNQTETDS
jgi:hypothetical protein